MSRLHPRVEQSMQEAQRWIRRNCATARTKLDATLQQAHTTVQDSDIDPKHLLYGVLAVLTIAWATSLLARRLSARNKSVARPRTPDLEKRSAFKAPAREPGGMSEPHQQLPNPYRYVRLTLHVQYGHQAPSSVPPHPHTQTGR